MKHDIKITSVIPGIDHRELSNYNRTITATNINEALEEYKRQMDKILPNDRRYELTVTNSQGQTETAVWNKK